jgi:copper chaperone CopZ
MLLSLAISLVLGWTAAYAHQSAPVAATYLIGGLHCPPCTRTVESSLTRTKGITSAKVDWATKSAKVQFDETVISATQVADAVARTPHMMGGGMRYSGALALSAPSVRDKDSGKTAADALQKLPGVAKVNAFPTTHTLTVQFKEGAKLSSAQLIDTLDKAGVPAKTYWTDRSLWAE